eukprot:2275377-Rhodomonas_salina.2
MVLPGRHSTVPAEVGGQKRMGRYRYLWPYAPATKYPVLRYVLLPTSLLCACYETSGTNSEACYEMPGTDAAYGATRAGNGAKGGLSTPLWYLPTRCPRICRRACYALPGLNPLHSCYAMPGTDLADLPTPLLYAMPSTDLAYLPTHFTTPFPVLN